MTNVTNEELNRIKLRDPDVHYKDEFDIRGLQTCIWLLILTGAGMWVWRPGLGLETDQDHFFEVLVLVFVSEGGLEQDLRLCAC